MIKTILVGVSVAMFASLTAAQAHEYSQSNSAPLVSANAAVASPHTGLLNLNANVGQTSSGSLLGLNVDVGGRSGLATVNATVGGAPSCDYCGGVGHW